MNKLKAALLIFAFSLSNLHCTENQFAFDDKPVGPSLTDEEVEDRLEEINRRCGGTVPTVQSYTISFPNPNVTCPWNQNGNLAPRNEYFQGRIEQVVPVSVPAGATICDLDFTFPNQSFRFDDMFILNLNHIVLASSYNYSPRFTKTGGLDYYEWSSLVGMHWDSSQEGVFCTGTSSGMSNCSWPQTDTPGSIAMRFDSQIIRTVMAASRPGSENFFEMVSIGDNDDLDCEHSDISFTVRAHYVQ